MAVRGQSARETQDEIERQLKRRYGRSGTWTERAIIVVIAMIVGAAIAIFTLPLWPEEAQDWVSRVQDEIGGVENQSVEPSGDAKGDEAQETNSE